MGHGKYSLKSRANRSKTQGYDTKSRADLFKKRSLDNRMNPHGITVRESRDSDEHPNSTPIILGLDVTGSMGAIPHKLLKDGLPTIMGTILERGIPDPQLCFLGIGDHKFDQAPLQVAQFESSDELLDQWLTNVYLEGGGGGNAGESYLLAWLFGAYYTAIDSLEKRDEKGYLFTIGDEPCLKHLPESTITDIMGNHQHGSLSAAELLEAVKEKYHVYHLLVQETYSGSDPKVKGDWTELMQEGLIVIDDYHDIPKTIAQTIIDHSGKKASGLGSSSSSKDVDIIL